MLFNTENKKILVSKEEPDWLRKIFPDPNKPTTILDIAEMVEKYLETNPTPEYFQSINPVFVDYIDLLKLPKGK